MVVSVKTKEEFEQKLNEAGSKLVLVDFFAIWCGPCKMIAPKLVEFSAKYTDVVIIKVDVDECEDLAADYKITSMPTFVFLKEGKEVERFSGANAEKLADRIENLK